MEKPWYKRLKLMTALGTVVLMAVTRLAGPEWAEMTWYILIAGLAVVTGHTVTDVAAQLKKPK